MGSAESRQREEDERMMDEARSGNSTELTFSWHEGDPLRRALPSGVEELRHLETLKAAEVGLRHLPVNIGRLDSLRELIAPHNELRQLPETMNMLGALRVLDLRQNVIRSMTSATFQGMAELRELNLHGNRVEALPSSVGELRSLQILRVGENLLKTLPDSLGALPLLEIHAESNKITRLGNALLQGLSQLEVLNLAKNPLTELGTADGPAWGLQRLRLLDLSSCQIRDRAQFASLGCEEVRLAGNGLTELLHGLCGMGAVRRLYLDRNRIEALPEDMVGLVGLEELRLADNQLTTLPDCLTQLPELSVLDVAGNQLAELPPSIAACARLTVLTAERNPLRRPSLSVTRQGPEAVREYFSRPRNGSQ